MVDVSVRLQGILRRYDDYHRGIHLLGNDCVFVLSFMWGACRVQKRGFCEAGSVRSTNPCHHSGHTPRIKRRTLSWTMAGKRESGGVRTVHALCKQRKKGGHSHIHKNKNGKKRKKRGRNIFLSSWV